MLVVLYYTTCVIFIYALFVCQCHTIVYLVIIVM